ERTQPFHHFGARQAEPAAARDLDGDEIAFLRAVDGGSRNGELAAETLLVDRNQPPAVADLAEHAEHAVLGAVDDLDGAALVGNGVLAFGRLFDPQQRLVADPRHLDGPGPARYVQADLGRLAVGFRIPFRGNRDQLAVAVASADVGEDDAG